MEFYNRGVSINFDSPEDFMKYAQDCGNTKLTRENIAVSLTMFTESLILNLNIQNNLKVCDLDSELLELLEALVKKNQRLYE